MKVIFSAIGMSLICATGAFAETTLQKWQTEALKQVKAEKQVIDARWRMPETNVMWVAITPDGTRRDGFAQYICLLINSAGAPEGDLKTVWIYDPASFHAGGDAMGMAACR